MKIPGRESTARSSSSVNLASVLGLTLIAFIVLFWRLGAATFWDPDEAHYAETTRELLMSNDWMAPHYNGEPFFDKPILFHWLQAIPMALGGPTEFAARLAPAVAALALILVTAWLGAVLMSGDAAIMAALLLATSPAVFALARYAILDTVFTFFLFSAGSLVVVAALCHRPRLQWLGYFAIALAVLTKGPVALVLCGLAFGLAICLSAEARARLLTLHLFWGTVLVVVIAAPWFVYMGLRFGDTFVQGYLLDENLRLYATDRFSPTASSSPWFYVRVLTAGLVPWTALVAGKLYDDLRAAFRRDGSLDVVDVLLWSWTIAIVAFFTFSKFKLDHYVFPVAPSIGLIVARAWVSLRIRPDDPRLRGARIGQLLLGPLLIGAALAGGFLVVARLDVPRSALLVCAFVSAAGVYTFFVVNMKWRPVPVVPWAVFGALAAIFAGAIVWVLPALEQRKVVPEVARWVSTRAATSDRIATYRLNRWNTAFRFYVERQVRMIDAADEATALFNGSEPFYCTMTGSEYDAFIHQGAPLQVVFERQGMWATSGRALWRGSQPLSRFVVVTRK